jgi:hypothetical protein
VRFCPWYPLGDAAAHAPPSPNILQVRLARGLRSYPRGKSAMVLYQRADDARAAAAELAARWPGAALLCRHMIDDDDGDDDRDDPPAAATIADPGPAFWAASCDKLTAEFLRRFGALPTYGEPDEAG